jgi:hypothetical protein
MHTKPSRSIAFAGGALLVGLIVGYIIGRQSDVSPSSISSAVVKSGDQATRSERAVEEGALIDGNSGAQRARTRVLWANQVADLYAKVEPGNRLRDLRRFSKRRSIVANLIPRVAC